MPKAVDTKGGGTKNQPSGVSSGMGTHANPDKGSDKSAITQASQAPHDSGLGSC